MSRYQTSGVLWLAAAALGAGVTIAFRDDDAWYAITLVASAIAAVVGVLLLWRPASPVVLWSTIGGIAWVALYTVLVIVQSDEIQAWATDALLAAIGATTAFVAYSAGRQAAG